VHEIEKRTGQPINLLMETRSKQKYSISKSTRSAVKADKSRQAALKQLYHSSLLASTSSNGNKNKRSEEQQQQQREPTASSERSSSESIKSMSPIRIMQPTTDEMNNITPESKQQDSSPPLPQGTSTVEATADEVTETPEQREARRKSHPLKDISEPLPTDCLFGRGGGTNHHPGNKLYRKMVEDKKETYLKSKRLDKPLVAMEIIKEWRALDPPGRFLKQDEVTKLWSDVGDKKAREKTSQALREKSGKDKEDDGEEYDKQTRFESGTKLQRGNLVTRDHSLGTEIIGNNDYFSMEGFSWDEHDNQGQQYSTQPHVRENSLAHNPLPGAAVNHPAQNSFGGYPPSSSHPPPPPPPPPHHHHHPSPHHYHPQHSPHHPSHHHYYSPQHEYHHRPPSAPHHDRGRNNSLSMNPLPGASTANAATNAFEDERSRSSWGHAPSYSYDGRAPPPPLPPPSYYGYGPPAGWGHGPPPPHHYRPPQSAFAPYEDHIQYYDEMKPAGSPQDFTKIADLMGQEDEKMERSNSAGSKSIDRSSSWGGYERKHSLVLRDTSIGSFAPFDTNEEVGAEFDETAIQRSKSMPFRNNDDGSFPSPPQPAQTRKKPECVEKEASPVEGGQNNADKPSLMRKISGGGLRGAPVPDLDGVVRPEPVKRDTSNQPESLETKRSVKRVVLSRDMSAVSRTLKEEQNRKAGAATGPMKADLIDRNLSVEMNKLGFGDRPTSFSRLTTDQMLTSMLDDDVQNSLLETQPLTLNDRLPTLDTVALGIAAGERTQSCELDDALELIMEDDKAVTTDAPIAVNEDIAAKWLKGDSFAEDDQVGV
jgi:hypothetical protein